MGWETRDKDVDEDERKQNRKEEEEEEERGNVNNEYEASPLLIGAVKIVMVGVRQASQAAL